MLSFFDQEGARHREGLVTIGWTEAALRSSGVVGVFCRRSVTLVVMSPLPYLT